MIKGLLIATEVQEYFRDSLCFLLRGAQEAGARSRDLWQPAEVVIKHGASRGSCPARAVRCRHCLIRRAVGATAAVLISSPEYAHGVPGVLKNALDWIVGSGELIGKPVGLINASARATFAWTSLVETLTVMSARLVPDASITIPLHGSSLNETNIAADFALATSLRQATQALATAAREASSRPQDETRVVP